MRPLLPLPLLPLLLLLLAAEPGAAPADAELRSRLRESLARKRASARLPRHAAHDFAALQEGAQTALQEQYHKNLTLVEGETMAVTVLKQVMEEKLTLTLTPASTRIPTRTPTRTLSLTLTLTLSR